MQDQETEFRNVKSWYPNMFPQGTVVSSGLYDSTFYVVESVREDRHAQFCLNVRELIDGETPSSSVEELYPAWVDKIVTRGNGPLMRVKLFTPWHFPEGTIFEVHYDLYSGDLYDAGQRVEILTFEAGSITVDDEGYYRIICRCILPSGIQTNYTDTICVNHVDKIIKRGQGNVYGTSAWDLSMAPIVANKSPEVGTSKGWVTLWQARRIAYRAATESSKNGMLGHWADGINITWINDSIERASWCKRLPAGVVIVNRKRLKRWIAQNIRRMLRKD